ncbi:MAG: putative manganese transporter [Desulfatiglandaceae bacterium]|jgi:hypothetical protein
MEIFPIIKHSLLITFFVFSMMLLVDFVNIATRGSMSGLVRGGRWRQYTLASFLGSTPGCLGAFMNVTLYVHGMISFGAVTGGMIATSGDEAFIMLSQFPGTALMLFGLLFILGIGFAWVSDQLINILHVVPCEACFQADCEECLGNVEEPHTDWNTLQHENLWKNLKDPSFTRFLLFILIGSFLVLVIAGMIGDPDWTWKRVTFLSLTLSSLYIIMVSSEHYLHAHIWEHIIKRHLFRVFLWTFGALFFLHWGLSFWNLDAIIKTHMMWVLLMAALMGVVPDSGPHLIFVMMYAKGIIPFSVLLTSSFVQDGHGMLPLLSFSIKDSILIKAFNFVFGIGIGCILYAFGV